MRNFLTFWRACLREGAHGSAPFANDWQWVIGNPTIAALGPTLLVCAASIFGIGYVNADHPILGPLLVGLAAFVVTWVATVLIRTLGAAPKLFRAQEIRADNAVYDLEERTRQKLKPTFEANDPACVIPNVCIVRERRPATETSYESSPYTSSASMMVTHHFDPPTRLTTLAPMAMTSFYSDNAPIHATYYRVKVEATGTEVVLSCHGRLEWIEKDGEVIFSGNPIPLTFAPAEAADTMSKTIYPDGPEHLDFLAITDSNRLIVTSPQFRGPSNIDWRKTLAPAGTYKFHIRIFSDSPVVTLEPVLHWTGSRETSVMSCLYNRQENSSS